MTLKITNRLPGKRAFVTGAGSGLGRAFCHWLAADGWTIGLCDNRQDRLEKVTREIEEKGGAAIPYLLDVSDKRQYKQVSDEFLSITGGIDLLINNAGVGDGGMFYDYAIDNWDWIVGINQMGVIYGCHYFIPAMIQQGSGHIINISSAAAFTSSPRMSAYNVTKAAVLSLSESLYAELKPFGIGVSVSLTTFFQSNINEGGRGDARSLEIAKMLVKSSRLTAKEVSGRILDQAAKGKFYIVFPMISKLFYTAKRMAPGLFLRLNTIALKRQENIFNWIKNRYEKVQRKAVDQ